MTTLHDLRARIAEHLLDAEKRLRHSDHNGAFDSEAQYRIEIFSELLRSIDDIPAVPSSTEHARSPDAPRLVVIETPYAGNVELNTAYARACTFHALTVHCEAPFASHLLYTQVLNDQHAAQRSLGMSCGFAWGRMAEASVAYVDLGISPGMWTGLREAHRAGRVIEFRALSRQPRDEELREWQRVLNLP